MNPLKLENYNLDLTLLGGQTFSWQKIGDEYFGSFKEKIVKLQIPMPNCKQANDKSNKPNIIFWQTYPQQNDWDFVKNHFNLEHNYEETFKEITKDPIIKNIIGDQQVVRILKQDFEQSLISFILASHKNIKAIRRIINSLLAQYGDSIEIEGQTFYTFPTSEKLQSLTLEDWKKLGAGFRAKYLLDAISRILDLRLKIEDLTEDDARSELLKFYGVGEKIADCILVFGLGHYSTTPIDIWAKRAIVDLYQVDEKLNYQKLREEYQKRFGKHTAFAGQVLFEYVRTKTKN